MSIRRTSLFVCLLLACNREPERAPVPLYCSQTIEGCECGQIGCSCADDGRCEQGSCNPHSGTCVLERDGMVFVAPGWFWMGCNPEVDAYGERQGQGFHIPPTCDDEPFLATPFRRVYLDGYWIDRTEVTKAEYRDCIDAGACPVTVIWDQEYAIENVGQPLPDDRPVGALTWWAAKQFCEWKGKRLPSEAEWEKAARGTDGRKYPWGNAPEPDCTLANHLWMGPQGYAECSPIRLGAVGSLPAGTSPYGAVDMVGNIQEWTRDAYDDPGGYASLPDRNPIKLEGYSRVRRGCSYQCPTVGIGGYILRTSMRYIGAPDADWEYPTQGVRCARDGGPAGASERPVVPQINGSSGMP